MSIAKNVIFVSDDSSHHYYIPVEKLEHWNKWVGSEEWELGEVPDYATLVDGEIYIVDIVGVL